MSGAAPALPISDALAPDPDLDLLFWHFPGHGAARGICQTVTKVGHHKTNGRWCLWDQLYSCPASECPACFDQPGGYAGREAAAIADRLEKYFDWRNLVIIREGEARRAQRLLGRKDAIARRRSLGRARNRRPVHVIVAPPPERWAEIRTIDGYRSLRTEAYEQARERGVDGGVAVFHHQRLRSSRWNGNASHFEPDELDVPADGPHWHIIGDGWVEPRGPLHQRAHDLAVRHQDVARLFLDRVRELETRPLPRPTRATLSGYLKYSIPPVLYGLTEAFAIARHKARAEWFVSNLGVRVSVYATAFYILTHAGFASPPSSPEMSRVVTSYPRGRAPVQTVTWWGSCSARSFPVPLEPVEERVCERCGEAIGAKDVVPVAYLPAGPPPEGDIDGNPEDWRAEGINVPVSKEERSVRLLRKLTNGAWRYREPRGLERWEIESANHNANVDAIASGDSPDATASDGLRQHWSDRQDYGNTHEAHAGLRPLRRRSSAREDFNLALSEELHRGESES